MEWFGWLRSKKEPTSRKMDIEPELHNLDEFALANSDLVVGWSLCVTMSRLTPLAWLLRHGEQAENPTEVPQEHGIWLPMSKTFRELGIDVDEVPPSGMSSEIGYIPSDGGDFLPFLVSYRKIVENERPRTEALNQLTTLGERHPHIADKLGGDIAKQYVITELLSLEGCGTAVAEKLYGAGYRSVIDVKAATVKTLSSINGLGPKTVKNLLGD
jgi:hypothetical protein